MVSMCSSSYGCTQEVAKHEGGIRVTRIAKCKSTFFESLATWTVTSASIIQDEHMLTVNIDIVCQILASPHPLKDYRHAFQWIIVSSACIQKIMEQAHDVSRLLGWKKNCMTLMAVL